jgi:hypothetical protein
MQSIEKEIDLVGGLIPYVKENFMRKFDRNSNFATLTSTFESKELAVLGSVSAGDNSVFTTLPTPVGSVRELSFYGSFISVFFILFVFFF